MVCAGTLSSASHLLASDLDRVHARNFLNCGMNYTVFDTRKDYVRQKDILACAFTPEQYFEEMSTQSSVVVVKNLLVDPVKQDTMLHLLHPSVSFIYTMVIRRVDRLDDQIALQQDTMGALQAQMALQQDAMNALQAESQAKADAQQNEINKLKVRVDKLFNRFNNVQIDS